MVRGAGHDVGVRAIEVEDDHGPVIGEHTAARPDLVDESAEADLPQQEHGLTWHEPIAVLRHTYEDVESVPAVSIPNDFLTASGDVKRERQKS